LIRPGPAISFQDNIHGPFVGKGFFIGTLADQGIIHIRGQFQVHKHQFRTLNFEGFNRGLAAGEKEDIMVRGKRNG
jgi:hypothetical protein